MFSKYSIFLAILVLAAVATTAVSAQTKCDGIISLTGGCTPRASVDVARNRSIVVATSNVAYLGSPYGYIGFPEYYYRRATRPYVLNYEAGRTVTFVALCSPGVTCRSPLRFTVPQRTRFDRR